jgi:hypothetical protein
MDDVSALLIKLADRLHNMRTIGALSRCKQVRMASETLDVFAVLANRLGAWAIKAELEDLSFKALNPDEYAMVQAAVAARTAATAAAAGSGSSASGGLAADMSELTAALQAAGLEVVDVSGRVKNVYGVWKKIQKHLGASCGGVRDGSRSRSCRSASDDSNGPDEQPHDQDAPPAQSRSAAATAAAPLRLSPAAAAVAAGSSFGSSQERAAAIHAAITHIYDVQALRVVVPHKHDCYAAMRVVEETWSAMPDRTKDYIRQRKANGYQVGFGLWADQRWVRACAAAAATRHTCTPMTHNVLLPPALVPALAALSLLSCPCCLVPAALSLLLASLALSVCFWVEKTLIWSQSLHLTVRDSHSQPLEIQIRTPKMHYIAEYGFAAHWRYKERLGRQDLWLDRLVQWKKWVASEKLGIVDCKLRPSGSPGGSGGDAALADLAQRLQLERAASGGGAAGAAMEAAALAAASSGGGGGGGAAAAGSDPMAAELAAVVRARGLQQPAAGGGAFAVVASSSPADARFAARFRMKPISQAELEEHGASVMVTGPRGVSITQLPARCTVGQLLADQQLTDQLRRAGSSSLDDQLQHAHRGGASGSSTRCRLAVNGVVVMPDQAGHVVLKSGDQVQLLEEPTALPLLGLASGGPHDEPAAAGASSRAPTTDGALLPGAMADSAGSLQLFTPGQGEQLERALQQKLQVPQRLSARAPALVS